MTNQKDTMKKHNILSYLAVLLLALVGCTRDFSESSIAEDSDGKVSFRIGVDISDTESLSTRAILGNVPDQPNGSYLLDNLNFYIFVFEDNGLPQANYLRELVYGNDIRDLKIADSHEHSYANPSTEKPLLQFTVQLDGTAENAIVHIVATADPVFEKQLESVPDRSEFGIFTGANGLYTTDGEAYWKRIEFDMPINKENKETIQKQLSHVNMVRNFCRVTLKDVPAEAGSLHGFHSEAFLVVNAIDRGYVAAYNESLGDKGKPGFMEFEDPETRKHRPYRYLNDTEKYVPSRHPASSRVNPDDNPDADNWATNFESGIGAESNMNPKYMFERSVQDANRTFVILKGYYEGKESEKRYFKLDLGSIDATVLGNDNSPFGIFENYQLIRNISYDISITNVAENIGHTTVRSALESYPSNNISTSIETRPLTTIYDGIDKMEVSFVSQVIVDDDEGNPYPPSKEMMWSYFQDYQGSNIPAPQTVKWNFPGYDFTFDGGSDPDGVIKGWDGSSQAGSTNTPVNDYNYNTKTFATNDSKDYGNNWRGFKLYFNKPDDVLRQKTIRLYSPFGLTRDVTFILHKRWEFVDSRPELYSNVEVYPGHYSYEDGSMAFESLDAMRDALNYGSYQDGEGYVGSQYGAQLTVLFELPKDLPEAIFPLDFKIGFDRQNTENAYAGNAVVTWGNSLFEEDDIAVPRMQFVKTVEWRDYNAHPIVCARFLTTTDVLYELDTNNPDVATTRVRVTNPYFMPGNDTFERSSHQDVIDPTRTRWHWNFSYPEWSRYFAMYTAEAEREPTGWPDVPADNNDTNPHNFNNLSFAGYAHGTKDDYTNVEGRFMQPKADYSGIQRSADNPEFQFGLAGSSETGMTATMVIQATPNRDRDYKGATYKYDFYFRTVYVKLITKKHPEGLVQFQNCDCPVGTKANIGTRYRLDMKTLTYNFNIEANDVVEKVLIWSEKRTGSQPSGSGTYTYKDGETRYYDILFTLTPNPQN